MTHNFNPQKLQFYMTIPTPCPYLAGKHERKIFTHLDPITGPYLNNYLTHSGFRRSQNVLYRPSCEGCNACISLRVDTHAFMPTRSMRRTLRQNHDIQRHVVPALATPAQFDLLKIYLSKRHPDGGMIDMDFSRYKMMVEECATETEIVEYRTAASELIACALIDIMMDGLSMVYSFFNPSYEKRSLGSYMILDQIHRCCEAQIPWLYLGYWVKDSPKMHYKARYQPCQILNRSGWHELETGE